jgi:DNA polymerase-3 subunit delta'
MFRNIVGHRKLVGLLARSIERGTLPQSLILDGPAGVGKRLTAVAAAQALNCANGGCGACASCKRVARGVHPDVIIVEPGENASIKIEQVRDVVDRAGYRPFEGRNRAVIIDDADALVPAAQNALLKTLEEPPSASYFFLVTARPDRLLPTVRSRCPRLTFRPLGADDVAAILMGQGRSEADARAVAATADGSVGRALESSVGELIEVRDTALSALGRAAESDTARWRLDAAKDLLPKAPPSAAIERQHLALHLRAMSSLLRDAALVSTGAGPEGIANPDVRSALEQLRAFRGDRGTRAFATVDEALGALDRNAAAKIVADWVMLHL